MTKNMLYVLMKQRPKIHDFNIFVEQYSHGLSYTSIKHCLKFYSYDSAMKAKKYIKNEFHTVVLIEAKPLEISVN